jgi:ADP-dependent NAD(P)H-hydrate dehydratase / NAD(P)H-hydrate epimerase
MNREPRSMHGAHAPLRPYGRADVSAPTGSESSAFDRDAIERVGVPQSVLMENAGRSAAELLVRLYPEGRVVGLIGAGNNGGDALVLLRTLSAWGREVHAVLAADRPEPEPLLHGWEMPVSRDTEMDPSAWEALLAGAAVLVDGLLGTGVRGAPRERQAALIERVNASGVPVLAIDVPSGIDSDTGAVPGVAISAEVTVAFGAPKLGSLLHPARARVGRLVAVEIAFPPWPPSSASGRVVTPAWALARLPSRGTDTHKNAVGRVLVVAGSPGMGGAAVLSVRAALRAGSGLVRVCSAPENREILQSAVPEAIFVDGSDQVALAEALDASDAVAVGPGLGTGSFAEALLRRVTEGPAVPLVLDADALNLAARGKLDLAGVAAKRPLLLTPHAGEMSRLTGRSADDIAADRLAVLAEAVERFGCAVLLKGAPSLVRAPGGPVLVGTQGSSDLAVAGMGDSLTGVSAAMLAQGLDPAEGGAVALYLTGRAATLAGLGAALTPSDVVDRLAEALTEDASSSPRLDLSFVLLDADAAR